ncbi:metallopeptidase family M12-like protein [Kribbella amoyensis]|uniref:Metallopeptidase family M12-like protein n=1 Tax=Kribbella amoyensis TaxID=996641 RepID=A0A561BNV1_9ACTN|nr:zinc-dependent metalloprotease family protein [Kribbella amoyensis]TWD80539.1 metallopeptidase family M12-like protein [Kribbella amoyensis]
MQSRFRRTGALVGTGAVLFGALAVVAGNQADAQEGPTAAPLDQVLGEKIQGRAALAKLQPRLAEVAELNGIAEQQLQRILATDKTSWLDEAGKLFYREPVATQAEKAAASASPRWAKQAVAGATGPAFELHSKPGSNRVIYLDFDGHTIKGTAWNTGGKPATVNVTPYDTDGNASNWSTAEQDVVRDVWARVAEDYAPFDVDVTTQAPAESAITRSGSSDQQYGTRVVIDPTTWYQSGCGCGGVAYVGVYDSTSQHAYYQPALVFTKGVGTGAKNIAEAAAHEAGHNIGLSHDGTASQGYYAGHGAWAPIMGVGYSKAISQWSKGEYSGANNKEDDFAVAGQNGLALRADDHGNTTGTATTVAVGATTKGVYATDSDVDYFKVSIGTAGTYTFAANAAASGADLDIKLQLVNSAGTVIATANPASGQSNSATPTGLSASIKQQVAAGTYYLKVDNVGYADPLTTGYSTYGSRGAYSVRVTAG